MEQRSLTQWKILTEQMKPYKDLPLEARPSHYWTLVDLAKKARYAYELATINTYKQVPKTTSPGYLYSSDSSRKRVGRSYVNTFKFAIRFKRKMKCNEFDRYYKYLVSVIYEVGRSNVYSCLKQRNFTGIDLEIRDTMSIERFKLVLQKINNLFKGSPNG
jgi:hypothetical protein